MMGVIMKLYVYGTLRKGFRLNEYLGNATFLKKVTLKGFKMYDNGGSFPYVVHVPNSSATIVAELYEIDEKILEVCDRIEGIPYHYQRIEINNPETGFIYTVEQKKVQALRRIYSGDWALKGENDVINARSKKRTNYFKDEAVYF